ncbi:MAG TPA: F0F1 ATP synthase subunit gamma [Patescibacteria group bacterium]|nr:F0F1 ATP synthase subunit gamma [Patescibacteria group bacterium]
MKRPVEIVKDEVAMSTLLELTGAFEGIASMRIAQIKNQVLQSTKFFSELWQIYSQLRVDDLFRFGRSSTDETIINKDLYIVVTAEGGFSGDVDSRLIQMMLETYDKEKQDIIVIGHHGAVQLAQVGVSFKKYFKLPVKDQNINVEPIIREVKQYRSSTVFYQEYVSLMIQDVRRIELSAAVSEQAKDVTAEKEVISEETYIFEPSTYDVISHLESSMLQIALSQLILDSKLAQYASRFRAMTQARDRAEDSKDELHLTYNRSKRATKDERLKELINGLRKVDGVTLA